MKSLFDEIRLFLCEILLGWIVRIAPAKSYEGRRLIGIVNAYLSTIIDVPQEPQRSFMENIRDLREMETAQEASNVITSKDMADTLHVFGRKGSDMLHAHIEEYNKNGMRIGQALEDWRHKVRIAKEMKSRPSEFFDV